MSSLCYCSSWIQVGLSVHLRIMQLPARSPDESKTAALLAPVHIITAPDAACSAAGARVEVDDPCGLRSGQMHCGRLPNRVGPGV